MSRLAECAVPVRRLLNAVRALEATTRSLQLPPLAGREWFELLTTKLMPQLGDEAFLVVAVVGGTNIGKTVVFNHIAGSRASSPSPLASGTKHPTLLLPTGFAERHDLTQLFPGFTPSPSSVPEDAMREDNTHWLFWHEEPSLPENLLVLDTPDIDSEARINWERADQIRRSADVLVAVLTQQKYNDAAVKEFFRKAASEAKLVVIVFNQCQLPDDEQYWPLWVGTFCEQTGIAPRHVYLSPNDRRAAEQNRLPFYERDWPLDAAATPPVAGGDSPSNATARAPSAADTPRNLLSDLSELHFADIKLQTLSGSLRKLCSETQGVPVYLSEVRQRSGEFANAAELLSTHQLAEIDTWPEVPNALLVAEIRTWWAAQREGWTARVHGFYNTVGRGLTAPFRFVQGRVQGESTSPIERYREREWNAILVAVGSVYDKLTWMSQLGNDLLRPRLDAVLGGTSRGELLQTIEQAHRQVDLEGELRSLVSCELASFREESPRSYELFRQLDSVAAAARPATSVVLFIAGGPVGSAAVTALTDTALQSAIHIAGDIAGGTIAAAVGETAISGTASTSAGYLEARFRRLHAAFTARRAAWLAGLLQEHLLGSLPEDLLSAAHTASSPEFREVERSLAAVNRVVKEVERDLPAPAAARPVQPQQT